MANIIYVLLEKKKKKVSNYNNTSQGWVPFKISFQFCSIRLLK